MDELYRNLGAHSYWDVQTSDADTFEATEVWLNQASGRATAKHRIVRVAALEEWLAEVSQVSGSKTLILVARFAWLEIGKDKRIKLPSDAWARLKESFGVELAFDYSRSCINGITALPRISGVGRESQAYSFIYLPKLATIWSHTEFEQPQPRKTATNGIILVDPEYKKPLRKSLEAPWNAGVCGHAMFLAFCISLSFGALIDMTHGEMKISLRAIEEETGFHAFRRGHKESTLGKGLDLADKLGDMSKISNGHATKLASVARKARMVGGLIDFINKALDEEETRQASQASLVPPVPPNAAAAAAAGPAAAQTALTGGTLLRKHAKIVEERLTMQEMDMEYTRKRLEVQIDALFHLVTWNDSLSNLALARSTHEIAEASYRDASSMKTLAVVTMLFLPGSFVSSLFSTDLFEWDARDLTSDDISVKSTPQLALYWAITIPLTVATFLAYFAWLIFQKRQRERAYRAEPVPTPPVLGDPAKPITLATELSTKRRVTRLDSKNSSFG